jgi:hypothetical protein
MKYLRKFGAFWYDFLIGDRPELFVGSIVILAATWALMQIGLGHVIAGWLLSILVLVLGGASVLIATRVTH